MFADERKTRILFLLNRSQSILVSDVAQSLSVSETTIRRDLQDLEEQGLLKRTHGGAIALEMASFEPSMVEKADFHAEQKTQIAQQAVSMIQTGDTLLLDSGTTTLQIARMLPDQDLTVVTNSLPIASELSRSKWIKLVMLGGELRSNTEALVGTFCENMLRELHVDKAFIGANGVDIYKGVTTANISEASTKRAMVNAAREVILVADHSKFGQVYFAKICDIKDLSCVITDEQPGDGYMLLFHEHNLAVRTSLSQVWEADG